MEVFERDKKYNDYLESKIPKTKPWPSLFRAFGVGGLICCFGEAIKDMLLLIFPEMTAKDAGIWESTIIIVLASFLTGVGVYDRIGAYAGAGSILPISGFSNSITSPALEHKREGLIFGLCAKMFTIAGPVIVIGLVAGILVGVVNLVL